MEPSEQILPFTRVAGDIDISFDSGWGGEVTPLFPSPSSLVDVNVGPAPARTHEEQLGNEIEQRWGVEDGLLVVLEFGVERVARIHRRLLRRHREGSLPVVDNLGGYFMAALWARRNGVIGYREPVDPRSDEELREYQAGLAARGNK